MSKYVDWEYYSSLYSEVDEQPLIGLEKRAAMKIDVYTHMRASKFFDDYVESTATAFQKRVYEAIKLTCCDVINKLYQQDSSAVGTGVSSVSNDGYSESYKVTTQAEKEAEILSCIRSGLGGTGLAGAL